MERICIYKGKKYHSAWILDNNKIRIESTTEKNWTEYDTYYADGEKKYIYAKIVAIDELDDFYALNYKVVYKGQLFTPRGRIDKNVLKLNKIYISTIIKNYSLAKELKLEPCDKMEYGRFVSLQEIDCLVVEKICLMNKKKRVKEIKKVNLIEYISNLP